MRVCIIMLLCCSGLLAEEMVEIPRDWLPMLQIPLVDEAGLASDHLVRLLALTEAEQEELQTTLKDFQQDMLDRMVERASISRAEPTVVEADIPALGQDLDAVRQVFENRLASLLGDRNSILAALRPRMMLFGSRLHDMKQDRLYHALFDDFRIEPDTSLHLIFKETGADSWERSCERRTGNGRSGKSSSSGGKLDHFEQLLFDRLLSKGAGTATPAPGGVEF